VILSGAENEDVCLIDLTETTRLSSDVQKMCSAYWTKAMM